VPDLLRKEVDSLVARLRLWTPARWSAACDPWGTRADLGRHLAQAWADRAADEEGQPRRTLPVLAPDLLVADQLAVTGDDLVRVAPPDVADVVAHLLAHRFDLLGEQPPAGLGGTEAVVRGRQVCQLEWDRNASTS
jgi:hypothetical protein